MTVPPTVYREEPIPRQLGALAATLARVSSCARRPARADAIEPMLAECMAFLEWTAPRVAVELGAELVELQLLLSLWRAAWPDAQASVHQRTLLSVQAKLWSDRMLDCSGLLAEP